VRWKDGVDKRIKPETAYWMAIVEQEFMLFFGWNAEFMVTSGYREGDPGAHGRAEAFDIRRPNAKVQVLIEFCKELQEKYGEYIGVVLEPEWGQGDWYTAPHIHIQVKEAALWL
jgi:hypothetical protein